jgi:hypothetical protein
VLKYHKKILTEVQITKTSQKPICDQRKEKKLALDIPLNTIVLNFTQQKKHNKIKTKFKICY